MPGKHNRCSDLLSRWSGSLENINELKQLVVNPVWVQTNISHLDIDVNI